MFEDGKYDVPAGFEAFFPIKFNAKAEEPQLVIFYRKMDLLADTVAKDELMFLNDKIVHNWRPGYYPPYLAAMNLRTGQVIAPRDKGYLGTDADGQRYFMNKALVNTLKVKVTAAVQDGWLDPKGEFVFNNGSPSTVFEMLPPDDVFGAECDSPIQLDATLDDAMSPKAQPFLHNIGLASMRRLVAEICGEKFCLPEEITAVDMQAKFGKELEKAGFIPTSMDSKHYKRNRHGRPEEFVEFHDNMIFYRRGAELPRRIHEDVLKDVIKML